MAAPMQADIMRQPTVLKSVMARRDEFRALGAGQLSGRPRILFGCGDGWFAARAGDSEASQDRAAPERFRAAQLLSRRCELAA